MIILGAKSRVKAWHLKKNKSNAKKTPNSIYLYGGSNNSQLSALSDQKKFILIWSSKKDFHFYHGPNQSPNSNT